MTSLLLDIGNSRLKWGVLDDGAIRRTGHISQEAIRDQGLVALTSRLPRRVSSVFASNVAGTATSTTGSFATSVATIAPVITNTGAANVLYTTATLQGEVTAGDPTPDEISRRVAAVKDGMGPWRSLLRQARFSEIADGQMARLFESYDALFFSGGLLNSNSLPE